MKPLRKPLTYDDFKAIFFAKDGLHASPTRNAQTRISSVVAHKREEDPDTSLKDHFMELASEVGVPERRHEEAWEKMQRQCTTALRKLRNEKKEQQHGSVAGPYKGKITIPKPPPWDNE